MHPPDDFDPVHGQAVMLEPMLRRIVAPNPSPMTFRGTNTYLLGQTDIAVIDPGPDDQRHLDAIIDAVTPVQSITHIIVTHGHLDHSPLAAPLSRLTGAPVYGFGPSDAGRSLVMQALAENGMVGGGEGIDDRFEPDRYVRDGERIDGDGWYLDVFHTPGHIGNHICLTWRDACFTADHVMGWASSLVSPPDGDLTDFMASCARLQARPWRVFYPGHGAPVTAPNARLGWLISHRKSRETAILSTLESQPLDAASIARSIYHDTPAQMLPAAKRNVLAHLIDLTGRHLVAPRGALHEEAVFERL